MYHQHHVSDYCTLNKYALCKSSGNLWNVVLRPLSIFWSTYCSEQIFPHHMETCSVSHVIKPQANFTYVWSDLFGLQDKEAQLYWQGLCMLINLIEHSSSGWLNEEIRNHYRGNTACSQWCTKRRMWHIYICEESAEIYEDTWRRQTLLPLSPIQ